MLGLHWDTDRLGPEGADARAAGISDAGVDQAVRFVFAQSRRKHPTRRVVVRGHDAGALFGVQALDVVEVRMDRPDQHPHLLGANEAHVGVGIELFVMEDRLPQCGLEFAAGVVDAIAAGGKPRSPSRMGRRTTARTGRRVGSARR
jgi:hypothetical protein